MLAASAGAVEPLHFDGEPEGEAAAAVVKPADRRAVQVFVDGLPGLLC